MAKQDNLDPQTRDLVRFAAAIAQGYEPELRERVTPLRSSQVPVEWVEELLLQSVLMVGYPRALSAFGVWRKCSGVPATTSSSSVAGSTSMMRVCSASVSSSAASSTHSRRVPRS